MLIHCRNSTVAESPERLPLPVISTIRVLLCLALAGCSAKDETVTPPQLQPQAPTIVAQSTVVVSDLGDGYVILGGNLSGFLLCPLV